MRPYGVSGDRRNGVESLSSLVTWYIWGKGKTRRDRTFTPVAAILPKDSDL